MKNRTIDKASRADLGDLAMMWLREIFSVENMEIENAFAMENKYRNIYQGTTWYEYEWIAYQGRHSQSVPLFSRQNLLSRLKIPPKNRWHCSNIERLQ